MQPSQPSICPTCKSPIPSDAPGRLCPACTLEKAATVSHTGTGGRRSAPPSITEIALHFPDLEILELLGAGGMGAVYKARQPQLDRTVALKILSHELARDPSFVERFNREAKVLARLSHPNIVTVFDFGSAGPYCYLLMEHVDGVNLRQAMRTGGFKPAEALALVQDVCAALQFAHEEGILHRDIKPENILIDSKGRVKIADFGIAKLVGGPASPDVTLTLEGSILGSPHYMAPEQIETPGDVDQRADIYSLGVVLYEMLTGELPIGRFALPSEKAAMDARIDEIVLRTLAKEREARFQTAGEVGTQVAGLAVPAAATATPAVPAATNHSGTARFSLLSAILTGISLIIMVVFFVLWNTIAPQPVSPAQQAESIASKLVPALVMLVSGFVSALVGFILGCVALGNIRESGGRKRGLGLATFGALGWPVMFLFVIAALPTIFLPSTSGSSMPWIIVTPVILLAATLGAMLFVRGVVRWAGGVERQDGERHHPRFGGALVWAILVAFLVPALTLFLATSFVVGHEEDGPTPAERPKVAIDRVSSVSDEVRWRLGEPEVSLAISLQSPGTVELRVDLRDSEGKILEPGFRGEAAAYDSETVLSVGTRLLDTEQELVITKSGRSAQIAHTGTDLRGFEFSKDLPDAIVFDSPGLYTYELASFREEGGNTPSKHLVLEIEVFE